MAGTKGTFERARDSGFSEEQAVMLSDMKIESRSQAREEVRKVLAEQEEERGRRRARKYRLLVWASGLMGYTMAVFSVGRLWGAS